MSDTNVHRVVGNLLVGTSHFFVDTTTNQVGVNTSTPGAALDVQGGDVKVGSGITLASSTGTITATGGFSGNGSGLTGVNSDSGSWVNGTNSNVHLATSTDKVGIGTTEPETIFQIGSKAQTTGVNYLKIRGNNVSASALPDICGIIFNNSDIASLDGLRGESKIINERAGNNYGSALAFYTNPTDAGTGGTGVDSVKRMVIDENGDLRVGGDGMLTINERTNSGFDGTARDETIALPDHNRW